LISRISEYLKDETGEPFDNELLELYLKAGHIALFYDGLDEIADIAQRNKMAEDIATFVGDYPTGLHVATCRIAAYPEITVDMSSFAKFTIDDMDEAQRSEFIRKWYNTRAFQWEGENLDELAARLIEKIENTPSIRRLAVNPLMLTIMAIIYSDLRDLPDTRLELYEECVNVLMFRRSEAIGYPIQEFRRMMPRPQFILGELAYGLHKDSEIQGAGVAEPLREDVQSRITNIIIERRKVVDDDKCDAIRSHEVPDFCRFIEERTSILVDRGMGRYGFVHQTFQEYFAAYYLNTIRDVEKLWNEIKDKIWRQYWWEVLLLLSEMLAQSRDVLDVLLEKIIGETKEELRGVPSPLLLLADIVIQGTPVTDFFKSRILERLYETCLAYGEVSGNFADRLGKLGDHGLNEETYNLLEKDIVGIYDERRHWAIRYFSVRNDLIETYVKQFERTVEPYVEDNHVRECLSPLLGDLKRLAAPILRFADIETLITPWYLPPILLFYYRYLMEGEQFSDSSYALEKLSAGMFVYSSSLTFLTMVLALNRVLARNVTETLNIDRDQALALVLNRVLALALIRDIAMDLARIQVLDLKRTQALNQALNVTRDIALVRDLAISLALALDLASASALARALDLDQALDRILVQTQDRDWILSLDWTLVRTLDLNLDLARPLTINAMDDETLFHGAMIHTATLLEFVSGEEELPSHLAYALKKQPDPSSPYVRAAQLFRRFIRQEITPEEELEFQRLLNIEDEEVRHIFDLAYLTDPETREPIFRFRTKLGST